MRTQVEAIKVKNYPRYPRSHALRGNAVQTRLRHKFTTSHIKAQNIGCNFKIHVIETT